MSIYSEVQGIQNKLLACVDAETGEVSDEYDIYEALKAEALQGGMSRLAKVNANLTADIEALKAEEKRIAEKRKHIENSQERLKKYIKSIMTLAGETKVEDGTFTVSIKQTQAVNVIDLDRLPFNFKKMSYVADKKAIKQAIDNGDTVEGAELVINKSVVIK